MSKYTKRFDGRKFDETRKIKIELDIIPNADGSALFAFGDTIAMAAVYGPKQLHPQHMQNPSKGILRVKYDMMSFSVTERKKPGPNRRGMEISKVSEWALADIVDLDSFPNTVVDVHIMIPQANASTRVAGLNAAVLALARAGVPMKEMAAAVSIGKMDKTLVVDVIKEEEDYEEGEGATDIAFCFGSRSKKVLLTQLDGKISPAELKEAMKLGEQACSKIYEMLKDALKKGVEK
jgi:exosome complex component RRP41